MPNSTDTAPVTLYGIPASPGVAVGKIRLISHRDLEIPSERIDETETGPQFEKAKAVLQRIESQLTELKDRQSDREIRDILDAQVQIIRDPELLKRVRHLIVDDHRTAEYALFGAFNEFIQLLRDTGQEWVKDRIVDLQTLRDRIIYHTGGSDGFEEITRGSILFADEISPTEMIEFSESGIAAIVMQHGGTTSHAVIIAQSLGIPCIVGLNWRRTQLDSVDFAAVDANIGEVIINPDAESRAAYSLRREEDRQRIRRAITIGRQPSRTGCQTSFSLRANIEFEEELKHVVEYNAEGIGLMRTETLFLRQGYFDAELHTEFYRKVLSGTGEFPVTIRLLDIGGDKLPGKKLDEANPFLGWRGIRMLLDEKELLRAQLEVILRVASEFPGRVRMLLPMVSDVSEVVQIREVISRLTEELKRDGLQDNVKVPVGIMIEVPAIALQADEAARVSDFFSIGSNDLTQYVLAADRGNELVSRYFRSNHPAVWKLIRLSYEASKKAGIPINVCGEIAGNPMLAAALLGLGIRELSMNPASIPTVKQLLCNHEIKTFVELFQSLSGATDGEGADRVIETWTKKLS